MDFAPGQVILGAAGILLALGLAWVCKLNSALKKTPPEVLALSPNRWTDQGIKDTYQRIKEKSIDWSRHLPPKLDRRYVITGGCGGVGGQIVLHLLERGQPPESIRILDFRKPGRADMKTGPVTEVDFVQADITSPSALEKAFAKPWPSSVAQLPLTVFHTAALIVAGQRSLRTYDSVKRVNIDGTQNVMDAAKAAGATVFIATSSASVVLRPVEYWGNPFRRWPRYYWQAVEESDFDKPLRPHSQYFGNYAHTKAVAERIVCEANSPDFRTGAIRPANGIYGNSQSDVVVGPCLRAGSFPSWMPNIVQNSVHAGHISLGHLLFEAALLRSDEMPKCAGRPFNITDKGPPPMLRDFYRLLEVTVETPRIRVIYLQPAFTLILAHIVEMFDIASTMPVLRWIVPKPKGDLALLQPAVFTAGTHTPATDAAAQKSVDEGGLGYTPVYTTLEGMCQQIADWNKEHASTAAAREAGVGETLVMEAKNVGTMPTAVAG
ncbi:hypothetical protein DL769_010956 [Monosporascus sp. CRB-8-3]|nr:hypothetical protein DL769_010956 [Monosporascus sp. CRB-8-3]